MELLALCFLIFLSPLPDSLSVFFRINNYSHTFLRMMIIYDLGEFVSALVGLVPF